MIDPGITGKYSNSHSGDSEVYEKNCEETFSEGTMYQICYFDLRKHRAARKVERGIVNIHKAASPKNTG
jgi:hypothetical protein